MSQVWAILVFLIIVLVVYGIISSRVRTRRIERLTRSLLPEIHDYLQAGCPYTIVLNSGAKFESVKVIGLSKASHDPTELLPFPLQRWLVIEQSDGKRAFIKPESVRYYREV